MHKENITRGLRLVGNCSSSTVYSQAEWKDYSDGRIFTSFGARKIIFILGVCYNAHLPPHGNRKFSLCMWKNLLVKLICDGKALHTNALASGSIVWHKSWVGCSLTKSLRRSSWIDRIEEIRMVHSSNRLRRRQSSWRRCLWTWHSTMLPGMIQLHQEAHAENHPVLATKNETWCSCITKNALVAIISK